jgi:hypothetical protein
MTILEYLNYMNEKETWKKLYIPENPEKGGKKNNFIIKNAALLLILLPWIYLDFYKFKLINLIEKLLDNIFGPKMLEECENGKTPY